jgi:hypothetical protein
LTVENRHAKFAAYWEKLGKPPLEAKDVRQEEADFTSVGALSPPWICHWDYRIAGDRHWALRRAWVESDFTLRIEYRDSIDASWLPAGVPTWSVKFDYRASPEQDLSPAQRSEKFSEGGVLDAVIPNGRTALPEDFETQSFTGEGATIRLGIDPAAPDSERTVIAETVQDPGAHYRYTYRVLLDETAKANGFVDVKLDPARICEIYGASHMMQQFVIKKGLRAGRGHKSLLQDIRDIHNALDRWEEMLKEDGVL